MSDTMQPLNSNEMKEFMFDKAIGKNYKKRDRLSFQYAQNIFEAFTTMFSVRDEPIILEADIETFMAILAGFLEDYGHVFCGSNIDLNNWSAKQKESPDQDLK